MLTTPPRAGAIESLGKPGRPTLDGGIGTADPSVQGLYSACSALARNSLS